VNKRTKYFGVLAVMILLGLIVAACSVVSASGQEPQVEVAVAFNPTNGEMPEGIDFDKVGNMYVSFGYPFWFEGDVTRIGRIIKISLPGKIGGGSTETVLDIEGGPGPAGLAVSTTGNVYYAYPTGGPTTGVYRLNNDGSTVRLPGTENMFLPNGLVFDDQGYLFASDSIQAAIWRMPGDGSSVAEIWFQHDLLAGCGDMPVGANGIAYVKRNFFVANTTKGLLVRVPVLADGSAGEPVIVAGVDSCEPDELFGMDGIALDVKGNIFALLVLQNKLVRINPLDGSSTVLLTGEEDGLFNPASIAFGTEKGDRKSVFITNYAVLEPGPEGNLGPAVLKYDVGVAGVPLLP